MNAEDLRIMAASEHGYVASRLVTYREDGAPVPEAIRRLGALSEAVLVFLPGLGTMLDAKASTADIDAMRKEYGDALVRAGVAIVERDGAKESLAIARETLYEIGVMLGNVNARLDGSEPVAAQEVAARVAYNADTDTRSAITARWPSSGLYHGLVLINAKGERSLFGEPIKGQFSVQKVELDDTIGEPFSTMPDVWARMASEWSEWAGQSVAQLQPATPRYDAPIAQKAKAAPKSKAAERTVDMFQTTAPTVPQKKIGDYVPDDAQFAKWLEALNKALTTAGKEPATIEKIRDVFAAWKAEHATEEKPNPAAASWIGIKAAIVGT